MLDGDRKGLEKRESFNCDEILKEKKGFHH